MHLQMQIGAGQRLETEIARYGRAALAHVFHRAYLAIRSDISLICQQGYQYLWYGLPLLFTSKVYLNIIIMKLRLRSGQA